MNVPLTVRAILSAIGVGRRRSCALVILALSERVLISLILFPSLATDDWWLITTNPITERIESMVITTMSSVRVKADLFVKDETLLEEEAAAEEDDLKEIILRERLHEKRDIETSLKFCLLFHHTFTQNTKIHTRPCVFWVDEFWICGVV
jgi:hypothetical protein